MKIKPINKAPRDGSRILLVMDGKVIEGWWDDESRSDGSRYGYGQWCVVTMPSHGCGCCSDRNDEPTGWIQKPNITGER